MPDGNISVNACQEYLIARLFAEDGIARGLAQLPTLKSEEFMRDLLGKLTAEQLWALIVLLEVGSGLGHGLKHNQGGSAPFRVNGADRG